MQRWIRRATRERDTSQFIPALRYPGLTGWYDWTVAVTTRESVWRRRLLGLLQVRDSESILDIGCGTGTFTLAIHASAPSANVVGIDADEAALSIARSKAGGTSPGVSLHRGLAQHLPFGDAQFDLVVSSLFFHHLTSEDKRKVLGEARRVLRPGGRLAIADWGRATGPFSRAAFLAVQFLDGFETTRDSVTGALPPMIEAAGFADLRESGLLRTPVGVIRFWSASVPRR